MNDLLTALEAMNTLNSWARNQERRAPRKAIYWLKSKYAIRDAFMAGLVTKFRVVQVTVKCTYCDKGIYMDWDGHARGTCYHCDGKGKATLKFIETTIDDKWVWHSPLKWNTWLGWPTDDLIPQEATDWTVKQDGINLETDEAARLLNIVEEFWPMWRKQSPYELSREEWDSHRYYIFDYGLSIGESDKVCQICGGPHHIFGVVTVANRLERRMSMCKACEKMDGLWDRLKALPLPPLSEHLQKWRERHAIDFKSTWDRTWNDPHVEQKLERTEPVMIGTTWRRPASVVR